MSMLRTEVLVVGAGIAGLSVASALAERGQAGVIVLEREEHPGYHATGRSAAILVEGYGTPLVRRLTNLSRPLLDGAGDLAKSVLRPRGVLYVGLKDAPSTQIVEEGGSIVRLSASAAGALVPALDVHAIDHAFHDPTAADIDVHALQTRFLQILRAQDGVLLTGATLTSAHWTGSLWRLNAGGRCIEAKIVVNAAGAWARDVGRLFKAPEIALEPRRRSAAIVTTNCDEETSGWPMVVDLGETIYFKPEAGKLMISPADETASPPCDAVPEDLDIAYAVDRFERLTRRTVKRVTHRWAGLRTFAPDRNPVLGRDGKAPNFFWNAGQGGVGVQTAPITAQILADLILGREAAGELSEIDLTDLSPQRFMSALSPATDG